DTARGVHDALLARVERVRLGRDLDVDDGVGAAVFPLDGLVAADGGAREERGARREVTEDDGCVLGVDARLHWYFLGGMSWKREKLVARRPAVNDTRTTRLSR